jgi:hypothetical protein
MIVNEVVETVVPTPLGNWTVPGKSASNSTIQVSTGDGMSACVNGVLLILGFTVLVLVL